MRRVLDGLAAWVMRGIDWVGFGCGIEQQDALHFEAAMEADPIFRAAMQRLAGYEREEQAS